MISKAYNLNIFLRFDSKISLLGEFCNKVQPPPMEVQPRVRNSGLLFRASSGKVFVYFLCKAAPCTFAGGWRVDHAVHATDPEADEDGDGNGDAARSTEVSWLLAELQATYLFSISGRVCCSSFFAQKLLQLIKTNLMQFLANYAHKSHHGELRICLRKHTRRKVPKIE